jgi:hypothetical protein
MPELTSEPFEAADISVSWRREPAAVPPAPILSNARSSQEWERLIQSAWQKDTTRILEVGKLLTQAREQLSPETFEVLRLPFKRRMAQMLMKIAANPVLADPANRGSLPPSWRTLYELTKLSHRELVEAIENGTVHPDMERKDVDVLRGVQRGSRSGQKPPPVGDLGIAWEASTPDQRRKHFDVLGREGLCAALSPELLSQLQDHIIGQQIHTAEASSNFAVTLTSILRRALVETDLGRRDAILERLNAKLSANNRTFHDVCVAVAGAADNRRRVSKRRR